METTVKLRVGEYLLTGVVFGGVDYKIESKAKLSFIGREILLFDRKSGKLLAQGSLKMD
jgi:multiple sugar transport system ATP-binding protein